MTEPSPKPRAILIADACSLKELMPATGRPAKQDAAEPPRYHDLLPFLAANGVKIIVPEMVAYEISEVLSNGTNVGTLFNGRYRPTPDEAALAGLLEDSAKGNIPNMDVPITMAPSDVKEFIEAIRGAASGEGINGGKSAASREVQEVHRRQLQLRGENYKRHFGDKAIEWEVDGLVKSGCNVPIFVLSEDLGLLKSIAAKHPYDNVNFATANALIEALYKSQLNRDCSDLLPVEGDTQRINSRRHHQVYHGHHNHNPIIDTTAGAMALMDAGFVNHAERGGPIFALFQEIHRDHHWQKTRGSANLRPVQSWQQRCNSARQNSVDTGTPG